MDLMKTIEDDEDVEYFSEDSNQEEEAQPKKKTVKKKLKKEGAEPLVINPKEDFDDRFEFVDNQEQYMKDTWNDLAKYLKKKAKTTLDEKIAKVRGEIKQEEDEGDEVDDDLSDSDLVHDDIKLKEKDAKRKKRKKEKNENDEEDQMVQVEGFFETPDLSLSSDTFYAMNLSRPLLKAIETMNFVHPTPIQQKTIPLALAGRDVCGCAATGTGKTAAYMLPVLERLIYAPKDAASVTRVLVLVPTRELGVQVYQVSKQLAQFTNVDIGISVGGLDLKMQEASLRKNPAVVIATPGRLIDHLQNTPSFSLENIEVLILDEADRMLEECFMEQMKEIIKSCAQTRQTLLFSATMTDEVQTLASLSLKKPVKVFVTSNKEVASNLRQEFVRIRPSMEAHREAILASLVCRTFRDHTMVFIRTKKECHRLHILLGLMGVRVGELHGNMSQASRLHALKRFKEEELDVLLTTDVAARGLDISGVKTVINYQLPNTLQQYIHRVGRTARAGRAGRSVSLADEASRKIVREVIRHAKDPVKNRAIPQNIIDKYAKKVTSLGEEVKKVSAEEQAEREIASLENRANRLQNQLHNPEPEQERVWFQDRAKNKKKQQVGKKKRNRIEYEDEEDKKNHREADYIIREAKRNRKMKKIRAVEDDDDSGKGKKKGGKRGSAFENDIVNVKRKNVKRLRHAGNAGKKIKKKGGRK